MGFGFDRKIKCLVKLLLGVFFGIDIWFWFKLFVWLGLLVLKVIVKERFWKLELVKLIWVIKLLLV